MQHEDHVNVEKPEGNEQDLGVHFENKSKKSWHTYISCTRNGIFSNNCSTRPVSVHGMHATSKSPIFHRTSLPKDIIFIRGSV